jgi:hypothetical protein
MSNKFFKDLKKSLEEVVAYKKGKLDLYSEYIEIPESRRVPIHSALRLLEIVDKGIYNPEIIKK